MTRLRFFKVGATFDRKKGSLVRDWAQSYGTFVIWGLDRHRCDSTNSRRSRKRNNKPDNYITLCLVKIYAFLPFHSIIWTSHFLAESWSYSLSSIEQEQSHELSWQCMSWFFSIVITNVLAMFGTVTGQNIFGQNILGCNFIKICSSPAPNWRHNWLKI